MTSQVLPVVNCFDSLSIVSASASREGGTVTSFKRTDFKTSVDMRSHLKMQFDHDLFYTPHVIRTLDDKQITSEYVRLSKDVLIANKEGVRPIDTYRISSREIGIFVEYLIYDFDNKSEGKKASWEKVSEDKDTMIKRVEEAIRELEEFTDCVFAPSKNGFRAYVRIESTQLSQNDFIESEKIIPAKAYFKVHTEIGMKLASHLKDNGIDFCDFDDTKSDWNCFFAHPRCMKTKEDGTIVDLRDSYVSIPDTFGDVELSLFNYITEEDYTDYLSTVDSKQHDMNKVTTSYQSLEFNSDDIKKNFYKLAVDKLREDVLIDFILKGNVSLSYKAWVLLAFLVKGALASSESNLSECQKLWEDICNADKSHNPKQKDYEFWKSQKGSYVTYNTLLLALYSDGVLSKDLQDKLKKVKQDSSPLATAITLCKQSIKPNRTKKSSDVQFDRKVNNIVLRLDSKGAVLTDRENVERILLGDPNFKNMFYYDFFEVRFKASDAIRLIKNGKKKDLKLEETHSFTDNTLGILASYVSLKYGLMGDTKIANYLKQIQSDICNSNPNDPVYQDFQKTLIIEKLEERYKDWQKAKEKHYNNHEYSVLNTWLPEVFHIDPVKHKDIYNMYALYGRKLLIGLVQRSLATDYATQCQWLFILRGKQQGTGKSYFTSLLIQSLLDKHLDESAANKYINNKKAGASQGINGILNNLGKLVELEDENGGLGNSVTKKDQEEQAKDQKANISTAQDTYTLKMKNEATSSNRTYIQMSNTNEETFLHDKTGNRRYLVVDLDIVDENTGEYIIRLKDANGNYTYRKQQETGNDGFYDEALMFNSLKIAIGEAYARGVLGEDKHLYKNIPSLNGQVASEREIFSSMPQINRNTGSHNFTLPNILVENNLPTQGDIRFYDKINSSLYTKKDSIDELWIIDFLETEKSSGGLGQSLKFKSSELEAFQTARHRPGLRKLSNTIKNGFEDKIDGVKYKFTFKKSNSGFRAYEMIVMKGNEQIFYNPYVSINKTSEVDPLEALDNVVNVNVDPEKELLRKQLAEAMAYIESLKNTPKIEDKSSTYTNTPTVEKTAENTPKNDVLSDDVIKSISDQIIQLERDNFASSKLKIDDYDKVEKLRKVIVTTKNKTPLIEINTIFKRIGVEITNPILKV